MNYYETQHGKSITNDKTITAENKEQYAMDAYQLNPTEKGTLAYDLAHKLDALDGAAAHNGRPRGIDLMTIMDKDEMFGRMADGSFKDEYIGDYFDITIHTEYTPTEIVRCVFSVFNPFLNVGDTPLTRPHVGIVTKNCFTKTHPMNSTNTTKGGYAGSNIHTVLSKYATAIADAIGSEHLIRYRSLITNGISETGASMAGGGRIGHSSDWGWDNVQLSLLSEIQACGANICSSSYFDTGIDNFQLPLFALDPSAKICKCGGTDDVNANNRIWWWLKNVTSVTSFCNIGNHGASDGYAANLAGGIRPFFLIG